MSTGVFPDYVGPDPTWTSVGIAVGDQFGQAVVDSTIATLEAMRARSAIDMQLKPLYVAAEVAWRGSGDPRPATKAVRDKVHEKATAPVAAQRAAVQKIRARLDDIVKATAVAAKRAKRKDKQAYVELAAAEAKQIVETDAELNNLKDGDETLLGQPTLVDYEQNCFK